MLLNKVLVSYLLLLLLGWHALIWHVLALLLLWRLLWLRLLLWLLLRSDIWVAESVPTLLSFHPNLVVGRGISHVRGRGADRVHVGARLRRALLLMHRHLRHPLRRLLSRRSGPGRRAGRTGRTGGWTWN